MGVKTGDFLNKLMSAGMVLASIGFFADIGHTPEFILPGLLFGGAGFVLALRRDRRAVAELELQQRVEQLAEGLAATQAELGATQERLDRLHEERDFMRQLAPSTGAVPLGGSTSPRAAARTADAGPVVAASGTPAASAPASSVPTGPVPLAEGADPG